MRVYDPRVGRFLSVDPLLREYSFLTPYQFASNTPIYAIDLDGLEMVSPEVFKGDKRMEAIKKAASTTLKYIYGLGKGFINWSERVNPWDVSDEAWEQRTNSFTGLVNAAKHPEEIPGYIKRGIKDWSKRLMSSDPIEAGEALMDGITTGIDIYTFYQSFRAAVTFVTGNAVVIKEFSSGSIRVSQETVNGMKLEGIMEDMKANGWKNQDPIDIVKMEDGIYTAVDHKRLVAAEKLGIEIKATAHKFDDPIPEVDAIRFKDKKGNIPKTWGEAVKNRIGNQSRSFQTKNPNGRFVRPKVSNTNKNE